MSGLMNATSFKPYPPPGPHNGGATAPPSPPDKGAGGLGAPTLTRKEIS